VFGSCRREVFSDSLVELGRILDLESVLDSDSKVCFFVCDLIEN
jgi:hypothetical protein